MTLSDFDASAERFIGWLNRRVTSEGRGDGISTLEVDPSATFWMGTLAPEAVVLARALGDRGERLDPCAVGLRVRPRDAGPWHVDVTVRSTAWRKHDKGQPKGWTKSAPLEVTEHLVVTPDDPTQTFMESALSRALASLGVPELRAQVRVDLEGSTSEPELAITLVNTTPDEPPDVSNGRLFETSLAINGLATRPYLLEALPDSFRYDRRVAAYGINAGFDVLAGREDAFRTTDTVEVTVGRPEYWCSPEPVPDLRFTTLAADPLTSLRGLVDALGRWNEANWSDSALQALAVERHWDDVLLSEARAGRRDAEGEHSRLAAGLALLERDPLVRRAFELMNESMARTSQHPGWRPFQVGFLLGALAFLVEPDEADVVDTVWFATGGGKTETYLGLLVTAAFHDRLTGKVAGISAWSRFPLRLLSLQQTQRFADALAGAELTRLANGVGGMPFTLGFYVGAGGTPNRIVTDASEGSRDPDPDSPGMPDDYQVLLRCPFCRSENLTMHFDRRRWSLQHRCGAPGCTAPGDHLPIYVVDQEVYRFLPTVVVGTLDKAAGVGFQAAMRGFVGAPMGFCSEVGHGFTYAKRKKTPNGCLVPGCSGSRRPVPTDQRRRFAPRLRLQDELHLLRDSLGAVDSHYESLLDALQKELGAPRAKIIASSATLSGHDRQTDVLYRRAGRVFPLQGPTAETSFWSRRTSTPMRRFVAVAPRGSTLDHVTDRTIAILQESVRDFAGDPHQVCGAEGIDVSHVAKLVSLYGTDVVYGSTLYDVEAADRSLASNSALDITSVQLTGQTDFDEVRATLERLENPEQEFRDRIHVVTASSMLSHGVDIERLNIMTMLGLPLSTAEFIQTSARVGRRYPGLVHVLHKIARERDAQVFRHFPSYVRHGDRFVEPIPITRRSRRVLELTMPGIVEARRLLVWEPRAAGALSLIKWLQEYVRDSGMTPATQTSEIVELLGLDHELDERLVTDIRTWIDRWTANLDAPGPGIKWPNELGPTAPMISLRDVEETAPIRDKGIEAAR